MTEILEFGIGNAEFGIRGKAQSAEGKALEFSDISDLSAFTLGAMRYALCRHPTLRNPQPATRNPQHATRNPHPATYFLTYPINYCY